MILFCFYSSNSGQFLFSSVHKAPLNTTTFEYFKLLCCMTVLALLGSGIAEGKGVTKESGCQAPLHASSCLPVLLGCRSV